MRKIVFISFLAALFIFANWTTSNGGQVRGTIRIKSISTGSSSIRIEVFVKNTGNVRHRFPIGCSLQRRNKSWFDVPYKVYTLSPGETGVLVFQAKNISVQSFYLVRVAIWYGERSDGRLKNRLGMDERRLH